jgi:hypothetical protein
VRHANLIVGLVLHGVPVLFREFLHDVERLRVGVPQSAAAASNPAEIIRQD